nr:MAG TPA: hypothetical protein [Caudoviricetes sp.]
MATTLRGETREGTSSIRSSGGVAVLEEEYHFLVVASSATVSRLEVLNTSGLPIVNVSTSSSGFCICKTLNATRRADQVNYWDVTATFSSEVSEGQSSSQSSGTSVSANPVEWTPIYETKFERLQEIITTDVDGDRVANSAGQPFETGVARSRFIPIWECYQFEPDTDTDEDVIERNEVVNSVAFKGRAEKTLLCTVLSSVVGIYYGSRRRLTRYALRYNKNTWRHKRLDVGTVYLDGGKLKPYLDENGNVILGGLDGSGAKVTPGTAPSLLEFDVYPALSFGSFLRG